MCIASSQRADISQKTQLTAYPFQPQSHGNLVTLTATGPITPFQNRINQRQRKAMMSCPIGHAHPLVSEDLPSFFKPRIVNMEHTHLHYFVQK